MGTPFFPFKDSNRGRLGGETSHVLEIFTLKFWEDAPNLTFACFFRWVGEKPPTRRRGFKDLFLFTPEIGEDSPF